MARPGLRVRSVPSPWPTWRSVLLVFCWTCHLHWSTVAAFHQKPKNFKSSLVSDDVLWASTDRLAENLGYEVEIHTVRTPDGYLLTMHRMPRGKIQTDEEEHRTPVLLGHGLGSNSEMWLVMGTESIAVKLVDAGYDVWMANYRGSFYGRNHTKLDPSTHEFWDFSWNENGLIDEPTFIEYILQTTGREKLLTIGHSMGSTAKVVLMSEKPEYYKQKISCSILLAPPIYFGTLHFFASFFATLYSVPPLKDALRQYVINDKMPFTNQAMIELCFPNASIQENTLCRIYSGLVFGTQKKTVRSVSKQILHAHHPNGASIRQVAHYAQGMIDKYFRKYDYGPDRNRKLYGSDEPPEYNISAISSPVYVFYGTEDSLVSVQDARKFIDACPTVKESYELPYDHVSYVQSDDVNELVIDRILIAFNEYV